MIGCIIVAEGECTGEVFFYKTQEEVDAFCHGVTEGAGHYEAGACMAYSRSDLKELNADNPDEAEAIYFINQYLKEDGK